MAALGKKKKAKDDERINALDNARKQHNYHIGRLEQMLRLLDNNDLAPDQVRGFLMMSRKEGSFGVGRCVARRLFCFPLLSPCLSCLCIYAPVLCVVVLENSSQVLSQTRENLTVFVRQMSESLAPRRAGPRQE